MHFESKTRFQELGIGDEEEEEEEDSCPPFIVDESEEEDFCPPPPRPFVMKHDEGCKDDCCKGFLRVPRRGRRG